MSGSDVYLVISVLVFVATILLVDGLVRYASSKVSYTKAKNKRLKLLAKNQFREEALSELRRQRGLGSDGTYSLPLTSFNRLLLQSGISMGAHNVLFLMAGIGILAFAIAYVFERGIVVPGMCSILFGIVVPVFWLRSFRRWRRKKIENQLPEALDVMRRSISAGHPLSVAISMVAREMPDPIGSEFGITTDEMTFGLDMESALENMGARVGQPDMSLLVVSVSIQSNTGGNLSELLKNLSLVIRERQTLRRKVKALSAEGRFSALALSLLPIVLFLLLLLIAPKFYGDVWGHPLVRPVLTFAVIQMLIGDIVMYKMVNFKF